MPWGATVSLSSGHYPQSNGQLVRASQSLKSALQCVFAHHLVSWRTLLPWVEYCTIHSFIRHRNVSLYGLTWIPTACVMSRRMRCRSVSTGKSAALQSCLPADPFCPPALIPAVSEAGNAVQGSSTSISSRFEGVAVLEGYPPPG